MDLMDGWKILIQIGRQIQPIVKIEDIVSGNQPDIALWNLVQLGTLIPFNWRYSSNGENIKDYNTLFDIQYHQMMKTN